MVVKVSNWVWALILVFFLTFPFIAVNAEETQTQDITTEDGYHMIYRGDDPPENFEYTTVDDAKTRAYSQQGTGTYCRVYVDSGVTVNQATVNNVISEFDNTIYPIDIAVFGTPPYSKINIYIRYMDGLYGVGGYFSPADPDGVYVDSADLNSWGYEILTHEFQHLIHNYYDGGYWGESLWINEGCSDNAIHFCYGYDASGLDSHIISFENNPHKDLLQFDNAGHDYGSSYAFVQYFWDHYGGNASVKALVAENANGQAGFNNVLSAKGYSERFNDIYRDYVVANRLDDPSIYDGQYGYRYQSIRVNVATSHSNYPVSTQSNNVERYGGRYIRFYEGDGDVLRFTGTGSVIYQALLIGKHGFKNDVQYLGGAGTYDIEKIGLNYSEVIIAVGSYSDQSFDYEAEILDLLPPETIHTPHPTTPDGDNGYYTSSPSVTLHTNDPEATLKYRVDGGPWLTYDTKIDVAEGEHTIDYYGIDISGNEEEIHSFTIKVDTITPSTSMTVDPATPDGKDDWYVTDPEITLEAGVSETTYFRTDGGPNQTYSKSIKLGEGYHIIEYWTVDTAGNTEALKTFSYKTDLTPPDIEMTTNPEEPDGTYGFFATTPKVTLDFDLLNGTKGYYKIDNGEIKDYTSPVSMKEGQHTFTYWAVDPAGNKATEVSRTFLVDTITPKTYLLTSPAEPNDEGWFNASLVLNFSSHDDAEVYYSIDGDEFSLYVPFIESTDGTMMGVTLDEGVHTITYYGIDAAGNKEEEQNFTIKLDLTPPDVTLTSDIDPERTGWYQSKPTLTLTSEEDATMYYRQGADGAESKYYDPIELSEGETTIYYWAMDPAGNKGMIKEFNGKVDTAAPTARLWIKMSVDIGDTVTADGANSTDLVSGVAYYKVDWGDGTVSQWLASPTFTHIYQTEGTYEVTIHVQDAAGNEATPVTVAINVKKEESGILPGSDGVVDLDDGVSPTSGSGMTLIAIILIVAIVMVLLFVLLILLLVVVIKKTRQKKAAPAPQAAEPAQPAEPETVTEDTLPVAQPVTPTPEPQQIDPSEQKALNSAEADKIEEEGLMDWD